MESPLLQYRKDRAAEYPEIAEQLDMIWHEIKINGCLSSTYTDEEGTVYPGIWFNHIQCIKDKHPKPPELNSSED